MKLGALLRTAAMVLSVSILASCGVGGAYEDLGPAAVQQGVPGQADPILQSAVPQGEPEREVKEFEFELLPETFLTEDDRADVSMELLDGTAAVRLQIRAENASSLRALYFQVRYDADEYSPAGVDIDPRFGNSDEMLTASFMQRRGIVQHGQVLIDPLNRDGFNGDGVLAELRFMKKSSDLVRATRSTPTSSGSAAVLIADEENGLVTWGYASTGDYDQNLETNVADLTPIASRLKQTGPFAYFDINDVVDGDGNDEINIADITPIGINFRNRVIAYNVYKSLNQDDYPTANDAVSVIAPIGQVLHENASGSRFTERLSFSFDVSGLDSDAYYWVRPTDNFLEGTPSNIASYGAVGIPLPTADIQADVTTGEVPLTVNFDASASTAPLSSISDFEWDLDGDGNFSETDNGEDAVQGSDTAQFTYSTPSSIDVRVRVTNSFGLSSTASVNITPTEQPNIAPVADIQASVGSGIIPLAVDFDASGSTDADGSIVLYEWDFDGDGSFDSNTGTSPAAGFVYTSFGFYDPVVRVTDDKGATDTASLSETGGITLDLNSPPVADIAADTLSGNLPLLVNFDASGSSDVDGNIVRYEWDFEGDGTYDSDTGNVATTAFTFTTTGNFDPTVRVTDDKGATDTASLSGTGGGTITTNAPPTAAISASPLSGNLPLTVNFDASASTDSDGTIVQFEWDFDGDGTWDEDSGTAAATSFEYTVSGVFDPRVRVTDDDGATDIASLSGSGGGTITLNDPPVADIQADSLSGSLPLTVNFDASASTDSDGTIIRYEWDYDGDGTFDADTGTTATTSFEYTTSGNFDPAVRVTDDDGATDTASLSETGGGEITLNDPPVADISGSPLSGALPLSVNFDASASTDSDGTIVLYEWDYDGDGNWDEDTGSTATTTFEYSTAGDFDARVRVTDNDGATDIASLSDGGGSGIEVLDPPSADITATPDNGPAPLVVSFDASGSTDSDGSIVLYEWDLDGNGSFETDTGTTPTVGSTYSNVGGPTISVRVTDDDGLTDTDSITLSISSGWSIDTEIVDITLNSKVSLASFGTGVDSRLGLAYKDAGTDDLMFIRTTDSTGYNWGSPVAVQTTGQVGNDCTLANINGYPGITFKRAQSKLDYIQATELDGSVWWTNSIEIDGGGGAGAFTSLAVVDGHPAAAGIKSGQDKLRFARATSAAGTSWNSAIDVDPAIGSETMEFTDLRTISGIPAILFNYEGTDTGLKYVRAVNSSGTTWGTSVTVDAPVSGGRFPSLATVSGNPAASYHANSVNELRYNRGTDSTGSSWGTPVTVDSGTNMGQWTTLEIFGGVPVIAYYDGGNGDLKFATADDATGTTWSTVTIDSTGDVGRYASMALLDGKPAIAYYDADNTALKLAIFVPAP